MDKSQLEGVKQAMKDSNVVFDDRMFGRLHGLGGWAEDGVLLPVEGDEAQLALILRSRGLEIRMSRALHKVNYASHGFSDEYIVKFKKDTSAKDIADVFVKMHEAMMLAARLNVKWSK